MTSAQNNVHCAIARGADIAFHKDEADLCLKVCAAAKGKLQFALDTVVSTDTVSQIALCLGPNSTIATAIKYTGEQPVSAGETKIELKFVFSAGVLGKTFSGGRDERGLEVGNWLVSNTTAFLESNKLRPLDLEVIGGLESVSDGLLRLKEGRAGRKLVARLQ